MRRPGLGEKAISSDFFEGEAAKKASKEVDVHAFPSILDEIRCKDPHWGNLLRREDSPNPWTISSPRLKTSGTARNSLGATLRKPKTAPHGLEKPSKDLKETSTSSQKAFSETRRRF